MNFSPLGYVEIASFVDLLNYRLAVDVLEPSSLWRAVSSAPSFFVHTTSFFREPLRSYRTRARKSTSLPRATYTCTVDSRALIWPASSSNERPCYIVFPSAPGNVHYSISGRRVNSLLPRLSLYELDDDAYYCPSLMFVFRGRYYERAERNVFRSDSPSPLVALPTRVTFDTPS